MLCAVPRNFNLIALYTCTSFQLKHSATARTLSRKASNSEPPEYGSIFFNADNALASANVGAGDAAGGDAVGGHAETGGCCGSALFICAKLLVSGENAAEFTVLNEPCANWLPKGSP